MPLTSFSSVREIRSPVPLLEVLEPGEFETRFLSSDADIRTDIPRYHLYHKGKLQKTVKEIKRSLEV